jgi:osmotically-inducible protein OsmY
MIDAPFYGLEPIGNYAIHFLVKNRVVTLVGVVDNEGDRKLAVLKAHGVPLVIAVNNNLEVAGKSAETK